MDTVFYILIAWLILYVWYLCGAEGRKRRKMDEESGQWLKQKTQEKQKEEQRRVDWWKEFKPRIEASFSRLSKPFDDCGLAHPLNEKQVKLLYGLALAPKDGLRLCELKELWGDQSSGLGSTAFKRDWFGDHIDRSGVRVKIYRIYLDHYSEEFENSTIDTMVDGPFYSPSSEQLTKSSFNEVGVHATFRLRPVGVKYLQDHGVI